MLLLKTKRFWIYFQLYNKQTQTKELSALKEDLQAPLNFKTNTIRTFSIGIHYEQYLCIAEDKCKTPKYISTFK